VLAPARSAGAGTLLYLFETTQSELQQMPVANRSATAKKAETMYANLSGLIERVGVERVGFVTLTTVDNCTDRIEGQRRFNSFKTNVLRPEQVEHIAVVERQERGAIHFHLAAAFLWDIRTGFDFAALQNAVAIKRQYYLGGGKWAAGKLDEFKRWEGVYLKSANQRLHRWWRVVSDFNENTRSAGFGRCETLPVLTNAAALARYLAAYVTTAVGARLRCDKGMRTVRYSLDERPASVAWAWVNGNGRVFRRGCELLGLIHGLGPAGIESFYGRKWQWRWRRVLRTLGEQYETALLYCAKLPEWADLPSRMGFLRALVHALQKEYVLDANFLQSEADCPF